MTNPQRINKILAENKYSKAANELEQLLLKNNISFVKEKIYDGYVFRFPELSITKRCPDVVIHSFSYGHKEGLFESYQFLLDKGKESGWLTTEQVLSYIRYEQKHNKKIRSKYE